MGCSASVPKVPVAADIAYMPDPMARESTAKLNLRFSENVSGAELKQWAQCTMGQRAGEEAAEVIVQIIGSDEKQCASVSQILQKLLILSQNTFDEETALLAQLAKKNGLSATTPRAPMPPPIWGPNGNSGARFLGDKTTTQSPQSLPPLMSPGEESRRIEQQNMMGAEDELSGAELKRIEARVDDRARTRAKGEAVIISLGLPAATQKVEVLAAELTQCKKTLREVQAKYNEALGAKMKLERAKTLPGSDAPPGQNLQQNAEEVQDKDRIGQELQQLIVARRVRKTILIQIARGGFSAHHLPEIEAELLRCQGKSMDESFFIDEEEETEINAAVSSIDAFKASITLEAGSGFLAGPGSTLTVAATAAVSAVSTSATASTVTASPSSSKSSTKPSSKSPGGARSPAATAGKASPVHTTTSGERSALVALPGDVLLEGDGATPQVC